MIQFTNPDRAGPYLPTFWSEFDPRPAAEQANENYIYGGWLPFSGFTLVIHETRGYGLQYPGDPVMGELCRAKLRDEIIVLFSHDWVAIIQPDKTFEVSRMD